MTKRFIWSFLLLVGCGASSAFSADATFYFGFQKPGDLTLKQVPDIIIEGVQVGTDWGGVLGGRFSTSGVVAFEQSLGYSPSFLDSQTGAFNMQSNLVVNLPLSKFVPYGTVGLGFISTWGDSQKNLGTKFTMNYGGGVKLRKILGPLGLRFDLRGYTAFNALEGSPIFENQRVNFIEGTVNLFISF